MDHKEKKPIKICKECRGEKIGRYKELCNKCYSKFYMRTYIHKKENKLNFLRKKVTYWYDKFTEYQKLIDQQKKELSDVRKLLLNPKELIQY